jgi:hypothetical protein
MENEVISIIKFGEQKYIKDLYEDGTLFMQRLYNYQKIEHKERGDKHEGISHLFQSEQTKITVNGIEIEPTGSIKVLESNAYNPFIYCTYALHKQHFENGINCIDRRCLDLGDTALVITDLDEFYGLIKDAISEEDNIYMDLVSYTDEETYNGEMGIFKKLNSYKHQSEHRIVLESSCKNETKKLNIGSLEKISFIVDAKELLDTLRITGAG